jgi:hypothetical protein
MLRAEIVAGRLPLDPPQLAAPTLEIGIVVAIWHLVVVSHPRFLPAGLIGLPPNSTSSFTA